MKFLKITLAILIISGCNTKELESEIATLKLQLDECQNGADKLLSKISLFYENGSTDSLKIYYSKIFHKHPESDEFSKAKIIYDKVILAEKKEKERLRKEKEKRELEAKIKKEKEENERLKALKKLKKEYDDVSGITWYYQPFFTHYVNTYYTSIYIGKNKSRKFLRLKMSYEDDDWIFFERAYLSYDGNTKEIIFDEYDEKDTDSGYGGRIWEWIDVSASNDLINFLEGFSKSKNAKMRFVGKYSKTRNLTFNERKGIELVLKGYEALK